MLERPFGLAGRFPCNDHRPGEQPTIFVDKHGTLCAMAYLIVQSGRPDMVERIASAHNYVRIHDLSDDLQLVAWLEAAGLTVDEAARIQPAYNYYPPDADRNAERSCGRRYELLTVAKDAPPPILAPRTGWELLRKSKPS